MGWGQVKKTYHSEMPVMEIDKQIDAMQGVESDDLELPELEDDWIPPTPTFGCKEHERVADAFFGSTAETLTGAEALSRRIQVVNDLAVLCELREPPKRGPKLDWSKYDEPIDLDETEASTAEDIDNMKLEDTPQILDLSFPTDQCIFCAGDASLRAFHPRSKQRPDSLRRHFENQHLSQLTGHVECPPSRLQGAGRQTISKQSGLAESRCRGPQVRYQRPAQSVVQPVESVVVELCCSAPSGDFAEGKGMRSLGVERFHSGLRILRFSFRLCHCEAR